MSQVKNLRAMFENKGESTSPPDRGRTLTPTTPVSDRPTPGRVRANFIAVEKDGRLGLQRDPSGESSDSRRRLSNDTTEGADTAATSVPDKPESTAAPEEPVKSSPVTLPSEAAAKTPSPQPSNPLAPAATITTSNGAAPQRLPEKQAEKLPEKPATRLIEKPATKPAEKLAEKPKPSVASNSKENTVNRSAPSTSEPAAAKKAPAAVTKRETKPAKTRPANLTVSKASTGPGAKSPSVTTPASKEPRTPTTTTSSSTTAAVKKPAAAATPKKAATPVVSQKSTPSASARKPAPIQLSPSSVSGVGFVKPKPKSPTKPVKLPPSLTAHTAASGSKTSGEKSPTSTGPQNIRSSARSSSRASGSTSSTLRRTSSNKSRPRPSIGPPPKRTAQEKPAAKKVPAVDEGFLARMMRPTQSSRSKTAAKAPVSPPRNASVPRRPATRQGDGRLREGAKIRPSSRASRLTSRSASPPKVSATSRVARGTTPVEPISEEKVDTAKATSEKTPTVPEKPSETTIPETSEEQKEQEVADSQQFVGCKLEMSAADESLTEPEVANVTPKDDAAIAEVTAEIGDLKVTERIEPEIATAKTPTEATTAENEEASQMQTSTGAETTPEAPAEHETAASISATNDSPADVKDEDETW